MEKTVTHKTWQSNFKAIMPPNPDKDTKSRLTYFVDWLALSNRAWYQADLHEYRDYLLYHRTKFAPHSHENIRATVSARTAKAHLATIRSRYESLLRDNLVRALLYEVAPGGTGIADKKAYVDEIITRIQNSIHPSTHPVSEIEQQDVSDQEFLRLKPHQVKSLIRAPGIQTLPGVRDTAMIALMVCTGIREAELVYIGVEDLRHKLNGELALMIRAGKGNKQRLVPYGPLDWCLLYVEKWLREAEIRRGAVFRGLFKGNKRVRKSGITTRAVNMIMNKYPITVNGMLRAIQPHDLRRTYARNAYEFGMDMERIRQNLGHVSIQTTQTYIGELDIVQRRPPKMFDPPHRLTKLQS